MRLLFTSLAAGFVMMTGAAAAFAQDCTDGGCNNNCSTNNQCQSSLYDRQRANCGHTWQNPHLVSKAYHKTMSCLFTGPCPSYAPTCRAQGQLAFQTHPYVRSPRDFFMTD